MKNLTTFFTISIIIQAHAQHTISQSILQSIPRSIKYQMATSKESIRDLICELTSKVEKLEASLNAIKIDDSKPKQKKDDDAKKPRNTTNKGYLSKAKMLFYHENKLTKRVQEKMKDYAFIAESDTKHNRVKWRLLKKFTDSMFDELSEDMQEKYMNNAKGCNLETIAEEVGEECPLDV